MKTVKQIDEQLNNIQIQYKELLSNNTMTPRTKRIICERLLATKTALQWVKGKK